MDTYADDGGYTMDIQKIVEHKESEPSSEPAEWMPQTILKDPA
jgi:hypothetical protein